MSTLRAGELLRGRAGACYKVLEQINNQSPNVWRGQTHQQSPVYVTLKGVYAAHSDLFRKEVENTTLVQNQPFFRQLLDVIEDRDVMVLQYGARTLHDVMIERPGQRLERTEIKTVAKALLYALDFLHKNHLIHTDVKPSNILVDYDQHTTRISNPKLCDLGDSVPMRLNLNYKFGSTIYRAPEGLLELAWSNAVDIWSFGVTVMHILTGTYFFVPPRVEETDESFNTEVLLRRLRFFGPLPKKFAEIPGSETELIDALNQAMGGPEVERIYRSTIESSMRNEDLDFLSNVMRIDPRDRPSVAELSHHPWFNGA